MVLKFLPAGPHHPIAALLTGWFAPAQPQRASKTHDTPPPGAGAGFTGGAAGAFGARTDEAPPPGQDPSGGLVGGGYDSARAEATAEGAVNQGGKPVA